MTGLLIVPVVLAVVFGVVFLIQRSRQQRKALLAHMAARGWRTVDDVSETSETGDAAVFPDWFAPSAIAEFYVPKGYTVIYSGYAEGTVEGRACCSFSRVQRRAKGRDSDVPIRGFMVMHVPELSELLPDFVLTKSHPLTNAIASLDSSLGQLHGDPMRLLEAVSGFDGWRVQGTSEGKAWLVSAAGQRFAAALNEKAWEPQFGLGVSGRVVLCEGSIYTPELFDQVCEVLTQFAAILGATASTPSGN